MMLMLMLMLMSFLLLMMMMTIMMMMTMIEENEVDDGLRRKEQVMLRLILDGREGPGGWQQRRDLDAG